MWLCFQHAYIREKREKIRNVIPRKGVDEDVREKYSTVTMGWVIDFLTGLIRQAARQVTGHHGHYLVTLFIDTGLLF